MRLASLTLQGFKSFGNRTTIEFDPGVTAIIGPNGSGKSNVIDALKWTSGGGRAREFRAADKTDLIFHGAAGKRSVGLAEVEVEPESPGGSLKVYRSLDREGTTRLRLNGKGARFLDVEEALAGSGLGRSGLAIIGQGEVSQVLIADPAKLLEYVAEAAGVARLAGRRDQTQSRLDTAMSHLDRLQDVLLELQQRCESLEAEAQEAQRHTELSGEALVLRFTAAATRRTALRSELGSLEERRGTLEADLLDGRERLAELRERGRAADQARDAAEERYRTASAELEFRRGNVRLAAERLERLTERRSAHAATLASLEGEAERLEALEPPTAPDVEPAAAEREAAAAQARLDAARADLVAATGAETAARTAAERARAELSAARLEAAGNASRRSGLAAQLEQVEERLAALAGTDTLIDLTALEEKAEAASQAAAGAEAALEAGRKRLQEAHERHAMASAESVARRRAAERQRAAFEARRGYAQGPRNALAAGISGVVGSVADLVRVEEKYQEAIAGALGRRAEYVVADTAETAQKVLEHVRRVGGFVTVMPLDLLRPQGQRPLGEFARRPGVLASATDVIDVDSRFEVLFEQLLGGTAVVEDMRAATALARGSGSRPRMVTLDGDVLETSGAMSGGRRAQQGTVLGAAADLEEAEEAAEAAEQEASAAAEGLERLQAEVRALIESVRQVASARDEAEVELTSALQERAGRRSLIEDLQERRGQLLNESAALAEADAPGEAQLEAMTAAVAQADEEAAAAAERLTEARDNESDLRLAAAAAQQNAALANERWRAFQDASARYRSSKARAATVREELGALKARGEALAREHTEATAAHELAVAAVPTGLEGEEQALNEARAALKQIEAGLGAETEAQATRAQELEETKVQSARRETALELAEEELRSFPAGLEALDLSERAARARLRTVEEELENLGPVNHRAANDLTETRERKESLEVEAVQATLAVAELESALEKIDRETTLRLNKAIERLKDAFGRHVRQLFGADGRGAIEVEFDGARPVGLRIRLQPPGKQTQSLHLLSVGERTMGALAFLFALMGDDENGGGLPVAVLDEVDAPLDEANIRRFCGFVSRLAETGTQFILITHQKATFEIADTLWGVTTEQGVSRVFSIRREETEPGRAELVSAAP